MPRPSQITPSLVRQILAEFSRHFPDERLDGARLQRFARQLRDGEIATEDAALVEVLRAMSSTMGRTSSWDQVLMDLLHAEMAAAAAANEAVNEAVKRAADPFSGSGFMALQIPDSLALPREAASPQRPWYLRYKGRNAFTPDYVVVSPPYAGRAPGKAPERTPGYCGACRHFRPTTGDQGECWLWPRRPIVVEGTIRHVYPVQNEKDGCAQHEAIANF